MMLLAATERLFVDAKALDAIMLQLKGEPYVVDFRLVSVIKNRNIA